MGQDQTLYNFIGAGGDGKGPIGLVQGSDGNFYGTTISGGTNGKNDGTVFQITPAGALTTLHSFSGSDGENPEAGLTQGNDGNFYGTTTLGGSNNSGTVFQITPAGVFTTLHSFSGSDGENPEADLALGSDGNFYGTTIYGGANNDGTVFQITPAGVLTSIHSFNGSDGSSPNALVQGSDGNFYGTTYFGGASNVGTVFQITSAGVLTTLYTFSGSDGTEPKAKLVQGSDGNFYGSTTGGPLTYNDGTIFRITPAGTLTTLHTFTGTDGIDPSHRLVQNSDGSFYGTTVNGSSSSDNEGTIFQITSAGVLTTLYTFSGSGPAYPSSELIQSSDGSLYGTTSNGGADGKNNGTVFKLAVSGIGIGHPAFFSGETALSGGVYYLAFANSNYFGYYSFLANPAYLYHFDLGFEYVFDVADGKSGVYLYDFTSGTFFYTSPTFPFPYLYDFSLNAVLYYYPDPSNPGHYNTDGVRYFYDFATGQIIMK